MTGVDGSPVGQPRRISRTGILGASGALIAAAVVAVVFGTGFRDNDVSLRASGVWLEQTGTGLVMHVHGATGIVDAKVRVVDGSEEADPILSVLDGQFRVEQDAELVYLVSEDGCEVLRFDEARLNLAKIPENGSVRRIVEGDDCSGAVVHADEATTYLVDRETGRIEPTDPRSLEMVPSGAVEVGERLASSNVVDGRLAAITDEGGDLVVVDEGEVERRGLFPNGTGASVVSVGDQMVAVGSDGGDTLVALPEDGVPSRIATVPGLTSVRVASEQLDGDVWMSGTIDGGPVMVGVDLSDGSLTGPLPAPSGIDVLGTPVEVGGRIVVPVDGRRVATISHAEGDFEDVELWSEPEGPEGGSAPSDVPFQLLVSAGRVWANSPVSNYALRCDGLGCTEVLKDDPQVEVVQATNPREPDPPKAVSNPDREAPEVTSTTTSTTVPAEPVTTTSQQPVTVTAPPPEETRIATPPGPVRNLRGIPGDGSATIAWEPPASGDAVDYLIESPSLSRDEVVTGTTFQAGGLANGQRHTFRVRARNASGASTPMEVGVTPTDSVVGNPTLAHVDEAGGKVRVDWTWPDGVDSAQLSCRSTTDQNVRFGTQTVNRGSTPLVVQDAPRNRDVVCDVTTMATTTTNVIRAVGRPTFDTSSLTATGVVGQAQLSFTTNLAGANTGFVVLNVEGRPPQRFETTNLSNQPITGLPGGNVRYSLAVTSASDADWRTSLPDSANSTGQADGVQAGPVTDVAGTALDCCQMSITWNAPSLVAGTPVTYEVRFEQPAGTPPLDPFACANVSVTTCVLEWDPAVLTDDLQVSVTVEATVAGQPTGPVDGGPWTLPAPPPPGPDALPSGDRAAEGLPLLAAAPLLVPVPFATRRRRRRAHRPHPQNQEDR